MLSDRSFEESGSALSDAAAIASLGMIGYLIIKILTSMVFQTTNPLWNWAAWGVFALFLLIALVYFLLHRPRVRVKAHE